MKSIIISADYEEDIEAMGATGDRRHGDLLSHAPVRDEEMISLLRALQLTMPHKAHWTIGITSTVHGEGVSSIARGLARVVARSPSAKVLICDVAGDPRSRPSNKTSNSTALTRASLDFGPGRIEFTWLPGMQVAMGVLGDSGGFNAIAADVESMRSMLSSVSDSFELTILDLPPVSESIVGPAMSKALDGVVLVVEAERTRTAAVQASQRTIKMHGGNVLGVVLNKRRFHIPNFIYRRL
jgi:protein-tyrosine kinase